MAGKNLIWVKAGPVMQEPQNKDRVAFHEVDDEHPGGSAMVAGDAVVQIAKTPFAMQRLREQMLVEASEADRRSADKTDKSHGNAMPALDMSKDVADMNMNELRQAAKDRGMEPFPVGTSKDAAVKMVQDHDAAKG